MDKLYIPGDLVMVDNDIVKVMAISVNYFLKIINNYDVMFHSGNVYKYSPNELKPIPITPEILEKNGWKDDGYDWYRFPTKRAYLYITKDITTLGEFLVCVGLDRHNLASISFVHQLQHLFFGLGINHEMEV